MSKNINSKNANLCDFIQDLLLKYVHIIHVFVNVEYQRYLFLSPTTLVFMSFPSPFQELQNDAKISRKKHWPAYKLLENTIQES